MQQPLSGIPASYWQSFLSIFADGIDAGDIKRKLANLRAQAERAGVQAKLATPFDKIEEGLADIIAAVAK
jgi:hypothetical protein